jgi:hypothetical protein
VLQVKRRLRWIRLTSVGEHDKLLYVVLDSQLRTEKGNAEALHYEPLCIIIIIIIIISCHRFSLFPGTSPLEPVVNPTTQASSLSL